MQITKVCCETQMDLLYMFIYLHSFQLLDQEPLDLSSSPNSSFNDILGLRLFLRVTSVAFQIFVQISKVSSVNFRFFVRGLEAASVIFWIFLLATKLPPAIFVLVPNEASVWNFQDSKVTEKTFKTRRKIQKVTDRSIKPGTIIQKVSFKE